MNYTEPQALKLLWTNVHGVQFKGKGIIEDWAETMERKGWHIERDPEKWEKCDLVFFGSDSQLHEVQAPIGKKPTILYFWGWEPSRLLDRDFQQIAQKQLQLMAQCTRILVPSPVTMDQIACFGLPSYVCLPGVNSTVLDLGAKPDKKKARVMYLSRLVPHKHLDALIQAMSLIEPRQELLVVGTGYRRPYQELADNLNVPVTFAELTEEEKATALRESAVLVHPSSYEGFGLPPVEALYCGTPVISFDIPQLRWLLQEDAYYFSTVEGLAETIIYVFQHYDEALEKTERGSRRIKNALTLEHASDRLWAHIHQVIKEHLAMRIRKEPDSIAEIYDKEHKRNWDYGSPKSPVWAAGPARFDPTWSRHWRSQHIIAALKECHAKTILDVGSGAVYPTIFALAGFEVHAVDISTEATSQALSIAEKWGVLEKIHAHQMDARKLIFQEGQFDAVIQGEIWEHLPDPAWIVAEGMRVLKHGGYLIATTPCGNEHYDPMHLLAWDDESLLTMLSPWRGKMVKFEKIAEEGTTPSCYFVVIKK